MKITNSTKQIIPVYSTFFKGAMCVAALLMTSLLALLIYMLFIKESQQGVNEFLLTIAIMVVLTLTCIWLAFVFLRSKIVIDNGRISWGYVSRHDVYIDDITGVTDVRSVTTLHGEQFIILRFSDKKEQSYSITVNSKPGKEFLDSMIETFSGQD
jgi:amino acid permease